MENLDVALKAAGIDLDAFVSATALGTPEAALGLA